MVTNMFNLKSNLQRDTFGNKKLVIRVSGFQRTVSSSENTVSKNGRSCQSHDPPGSKVVPDENRLDQKHNGDPDFPGSNGFTMKHHLPIHVQHTPEDTASLHYNSCLENDEIFLDANSSEPDSTILTSINDSANESDDGESDESEGNHHCSEARFKGSSSSQSHAGILHSSNGFKPHQDSSYTNGQVREEENEDFSDSRFKVSSRISLPSTVPTSSSYQISSPENDEIFLDANSSEPDSIIPTSINDSANESDDGESDESEGRHHCSEARFKGSSSSQSNVGIFRYSDAFRRRQDSFITNNQVTAEGTEDLSDSRFEASSSSVQLRSKLTTTALQMSQQGSAVAAYPGCTLNSVTKSRFSATSFQNKDLAKENTADRYSDCSKDPHSFWVFNDKLGDSYNANMSILDSLPEVRPGTQFHNGQPPSSPMSSRHSLADTSKWRLSNAQKAMSKYLSSPTSLQSSNATTEHITTDADVSFQEPLNADNYQETAMNAESLGPSSEAGFRARAFAIYRKEKLERYSNRRNLDEPIPKRPKNKQTLPQKTVTNPVTETGVEPGPVPVPLCQIPFTGQKEDSHPFDSCEIFIAGNGLREKHQKWLEAIPVNISLVTSILNNSCERVLLRGKCTKLGCALKHVVDLNLNIPSNQLMDDVNVFTKWFLENASNPEFRGILAVLSRLPKHHDVPMVVCSYMKMLPKLTKKIYRQALGTKLIEILVNSVNLEPWKAVATLLVFSVTQTTTQPEIEEILSSLEVTNKGHEFRIFESVSCLWHISGVFVCPPDLLFKLLKECLVRMPSDLKLLKDKLIDDLMQLPQKVILREFLTVDKFITKFYPKNSNVAPKVRSWALYRTNPASDPLTRTDPASDPLYRTNPELDSRTVFYETSVVKGTGPINPAWDHWDIRGSQISSFELVLQRARKRKRTDEFIPAETPACDLSFERLIDDVQCEELYRILAKRNILSYRSVSEECDMTRLVESLHEGKYSELVTIMASSDANQVEEICFWTMQELALCDRSKLPTVVLEILLRLEALGKMSVKGAFVSAVNSLVIRFHREADFKCAIKLIKTMRLAGVNNLKHVPEDIDEETFTVLCSEVHFECRSYVEAIRFLTYKECLNISKYHIDSVYFHLLERVVIKMVKSFLKQRLSLYAVQIFRAVLKAQESLHYPIDIGKFYEGVLFLSFMKDLKKNACPPGEGANLYVLVDRLCGNDEKFTSITYRSLLVELRRADSPEDVIRRTLLVSMQCGVYPDFPLLMSNSIVLNSQLTTEEMSVYLTHYFSYYIAQDNLNFLDNRPFELRFDEAQPLAKKLFPIPNDVMKTPRTVPEAVERLKSALQEISGSIYEEMDTEFTSDGATIPPHGVQALLEEFKSR